MTSTHAMVLAAQAAGVRVEGLLQEAGLHFDTLRDPEARIPGTTAVAVWNELRKAAGDPLLQLKAPTILPFGAYRVIDYLADASPTVGQAFERVSRFFRLIAAPVSLPAEAVEGGIRTTLIMEDGAPPPPVWAEYAFAAIIGRIRTNTARALRVKRVEFAHAPLADPSGYEAVFKCPVHFQAPLSSFTLSREEWDAPTDRGDEALAALLEEHAEILAQRLPEPEDGIVSEVRKVILEALPGNPSAENVAKGLHVSTRTLQRKLAVVGARFSEVSDQVRSELAKEYLADQRVRISEVAFLLGFSEQSSFNRAFRRWTGFAPGRWREQAS